MITFAIVTIVIALVIVSIFALGKASIRRYIRSGKIIFDFIDMHDLARVRELVSMFPHSVNVRDAQGNIPLHAAATTNELQIAEFLLANGADVNARRNNGSAPLHLAAHRGHAEMARLLLKNGADPNAKAGKSFTPLHMAAAGGKSIVVAELLAAGANTSLTEEWGKTPRDWAVDCQHKEVLELLS